MDEYFYSLPAWAGRYVSSSRQKAHHGRRWGRSGSILGAFGTFKVGRHDDAVQEKPRQWWAY